MIAGLAISSHLSAAGSIVPVQSQESANVGANAPGQWFTDFVGDSIPGERPVAGAQPAVRGSCVVCPDGAILENEPLILDGGSDVTNGGCNMASPLFTEIELGDVVCGASNRYINAAGNVARDTDWYRFTLDTAMRVEWVAVADFPIQLNLLRLTTGECAGGVENLFGVVYNNSCTPNIASLELTPGTYVAFAAIPTAVAGDPVPVGTVMNYTAELREFGQVVGACCDFDGNCAEIIQIDCDGFFSEGAMCADVTCITVECPPNGQVEGFGFGEFLFNGYNDDLNSGCNSTSGIAIADFPVCGDVWCGTSGNFQNAAGGQVRDTDWYQFDLFETTTINWRVTASFDALSFILAAGAPGSECTYLFTQSATGPAGVPFDNVRTLGPGTYYLFVSTQVFSGVPANAPYVAELICLSAEPQACCFGDGSCADLLAPDCLAQGGIAQGADTSCANSPCCVVCDGSEVAEGEGDCSAGYVDLYNSGCNASDGSFPTTPLSANTAVCGTTGNFISAAGANSRDTDWYAYAHPGGSLSLTVTSAGFSVLTGILNTLPDGSNCDSAAFLPGLSGTSAGCEPITLSADLPAGTYIVFVSTAEFTGTPCGFDYNLIVTTGPTCNPACGDVTGDGQVNLSDLNLVLANFGQTTDNGDANCDGVVNLADLNLVLAQFGQTCN